MRIWSEMSTEDLTLGVKLPTVKFLVEVPGSRVLCSGRETVGVAGTLRAIFGSLGAGEVLQNAVGNS
jgi:hypothetical protein